MYPPWRMETVFSMMNTNEIIFQNSSNHETYNITDQLSTIDSMYTITYYMNDTLICVGKPARYTNNETKQLLSLIAMNLSSMKYNKH